MEVVKNEVGEMSEGYISGNLGKKKQKTMDERIGAMWECGQRSNIIHITIFPGVWSQDRFKAGKTRDKGNRVGNPHIINVEWTTSQVLGKRNKGEEVNKLFPCLANDSMSVGKGET